MTRFDREVEIAAPPARVWDVMRDVERWHEWTPSVTGIRRLDRGAFRIGSRVLIRQPKFPPALWTCTELDPGRAFAWVSVLPGLLRVTGRHGVEAAPGGAHAWVTLELAGVLSGVMARLTRDITDRYLDFEAAGLKARSERPDFRHG